MNTKNILPHLLAVAIFFIITLVIYKPYFFDGEALNQHDILQAKGASKQLEDAREDTGEEALWLHSMFSGMPAYLSGVQYSGDLLKQVYHVVKLWLPHPVGITFLSFVSFYIMLLAFGVRNYLAIAGAILFGLNGFNIISISAGHNAKIAATALMPMVIAGIRLAFTEKRWLGIGLTALALGLQIRTNHPQMTYYLLLIVMIYGLLELYQAFKNKNLKPFLMTVGGLVLAAILAVGSNYGRLYHIYEYGKYSIRGASELSSNKEDSGLDYEYAFRYSNGIAEPMVIFIPNFMGGSSYQELSMSSNTADALMNQGYSRLQAQQQVKAIPTYWGQQPLTAPYYGGSILLFIFILGLIVLPAKHKYWLLSVGVLGIILSWGKNFPGINNFLFDNLPFYNKFRSVTFTIILPILAFSLIGWLGVQHWLELDKKDQWKKLKLTVMVTGGFLLFLLLISGMLSYRGAVDTQLPDWLIGAIRDDRKALFRKDVFRAIIFLLLGSAALWLWHKISISDILLALVIFVLVAFDSIVLSKRFLNKESFTKAPSEAYFRPNPADQFLIQNAGPAERVLNLRNPWNEARTSYYHESIGGYHGAKMRRYQDLIERHLSDETSSIITQIQAGSRNFDGTPVLNMLNTKFLVAGPQKEAVLENAKAMGPAWVVNDVLEVESAEQEISALGETDLTETAVINATKNTIGNYSGQGTIQILEKYPNKVSYLATIAGGTGLGVFSEIYYPNGWSAYIDGSETAILQVNYCLRGLEIPEGQHEIVFEFKPTTYKKGNLVMSIASILSILLFVGTAGLEVRNQNKPA